MIPVEAGLASAGRAGAAREESVMGRPAMGEIRQTQGLPLRAHGSH